jgi:hypothetical protein
MHARGAEQHTTTACKHVSEELIKPLWRPFVKVVVQIFFCRLRHREHSMRDRYRRSTARETGAAGRISGAGARALPVAGVPGGAPPHAASARRPSAPTGESAMAIGHRDFVD